MHGNFDETGEAGCLVPAGAKFDGPSFDAWLLHTELRALINKIPCEHILVVLDACYSGTFSGSMAKPDHSAADEELGCAAKISKELARKSRKYITASCKEKVPANSQFTQKWRSALGSMGGGCRLCRQHQTRKFKAKAVSRFHLNPALSAHGLSRFSPVPAFFGCISACPGQISGSVRRQIASHWLADQPSRRAVLF